MNILIAYKYLRLKPFDPLSEKGREDERYRLAALSILSNLFSKGMMVAVMILSVRLTIPYLGVERFGLWMTISSFATLLAFLDLGFGNALTNKVTHALAGHDGGVVKVISGGLGALSILACVIALFLFFISYFLPLSSILKFNDNEIKSELIQAINVFIVLFSLNMIASGVQRIFVGMQRSFESHLTNSICSFVALLAILLATHLKLSIPYLVGIILGAQTLGGFMLIRTLFKKGLASFAAMRKNSFLEGEKLIKVGSHFFILQVAAMVTWGADSIMIASLQGVAVVATYSILQKLFQIATQPMSIFNAPLWASYADAHARGEKKFIKKTLLSSMLSTTCYSVLISAILVLYGEDIARIWTGGEIVISKSLLFAYGIWAIVDAIGNSFAMFLNGCNIIKPQAIVVPIFCILVLPAKYLSLKYFGVSFMLVALTIVYIVTFSFFYGFIFKKNIRNICV